MAKKTTPAQSLENTVNEMLSSFERWKFIRDNGSNDPSWPDGINMNLVRNHILYYKGKIAEICRQEGFEIPEEYYMPTPPEVDNYFMANLKQKKRVQRLIQMGYKLNTGKPRYNEKQLSLF